MNFSNFFSEFNVFLRFIWKKRRIFDEKIIYLILFTKVFRPVFSKKKRRKISLFRCMNVLCLWIQCTDRHQLFITIHPNPQALWTYREKKISLYWYVRVIFFPLSFCICVRIKRRRKKNSIQRLVAMIKKNVLKLFGYFVFISSITGVHLTIGCLFFLLANDVGGD